MLITIGIVLIVSGLVICINPSDELSYDDGKTDHHDEFKITNSNYIERYYKRYAIYRKNHSDLSDDTIITYVNIGLDKEDYVDVEKTNIDDGLLMIVDAKTNGEMIVQMIPFLIFYIVMVIVCFVTVDQTAKVQNNLSIHIENGSIMRNDQGIIYYNTQIIFII